MTMRRAAGAQSTGGVEVFAIAQGHDLRADQAGVPAAASNGEGQHQISKPGPGKFGEGDGEQNAGQEKESIHGNGGESGVDPSAGVVGNACQWRAVGEAIRVLVILSFALCRRYSETALSDPSFKS
jgi:hypothetical protein